MEIKISTKKTLKLLYIISWIIFVGVCIIAGTFIFNALYVLAFKQIGPDGFWQRKGLSSLYHYDVEYFTIITLLMIIVAVLEAILFYLIVKIFRDKKLNTPKPFTIELHKFIVKIARLTYNIGLFSYFGSQYTEWLRNKGIKMPDIQHLSLGGADVWMFMGVTLSIIALIFKRGIEMQEQQDLTI